MKKRIYNYKRDLKIGVKGEDYIIKFLTKQGYKLISKNEDNKYDFIMEYRKKQYSFEVKTDVYPKDTGNIVIEFETRKRPSGISVCKADYFIYFMPLTGEIWMIKTKDLKKVIRTYKMSYVVGGDFKSGTKMWKIKKDLFEEFFNTFKVRRNSKFAFRKTTKL